MGRTKRKLLPEVNPHNIEVIGKPSKQLKKRMDEWDAKYKPKPKPKNRIMKQEEEKKPQGAGGAIFALISLGIVIYIVHTLLTM